MNAATVLPMIPAASKSLWFFAIISLILVGALLLMIWLAWSMQHVRFTVSNRWLMTSSDLYGRLVPLKALKLDEAVVTNLKTDKEIISRNGARWAQRCQATPPDGSNSAMGESAALCHGQNARGTHSDHGRLHRHAQCEQILRRSLTL